MRGSSHYGEFTEILVEGDKDSTLFARYPENFDIAGVLRPRPAPLYIVAGRSQDVQRATPDA